MLTVFHINMAAKKQKELTQADFNPAAGYILVEQLEAHKKTESGIYLPDSAKDKPQTGKVLAVGADEITEKGTTRHSPTKVGDLIIFKKWGGNEVTFGSKEYLFVKFEDVLAVKRK